MIPALLLALAAHQQPSTKIELFRGAMVAPPVGKPFQYWAVADTCLDIQQPDRNFGGEYTLSGGRGHTILIKFGDLQRAVGPHAKILKASLVLTPYSSDKPVFMGAARMLVPWGEGPMPVVGRMTKPDTKPEVVEWASSWKTRRSGENAIAWQQPGALGAADAASIADAKLVAYSKEEVAIEGIADAVQAMVDRPEDNNGFELLFDGTPEFFSCQARDARPRLVLEVAAQAPATGPDLSVTMIDRTPEYPRGAGTDSKHWPSEGEEVTYTAHIKNVGDAPSKGFVGAWEVREKTGSSIEIDKPLAPGAETTVKLTQSYRSIHHDHRLQPLGFRIVPKGPDANAGNDALRIQEGALSIGLRVSRQVYDAISRMTNASGSHSFEDWAQQQIRALNAVYFPFSRFSFAPDGVRETVRLQRIVVDSGDGDDANLDVDMRISRAPDDATSLDDSFLRELGSKLGLPNLSAMSVEPDRMPGLPRYAADRFPGLLGGGDTRFEGNLPPQIALPYEPYYSPVIEVNPPEATGLFAATEVAALNATVGMRRGFASDILNHETPTILLRALDLGGTAIEGAELTFFQLGEKGMPDTPSFTLVSGSGGAVILPGREIAPGKKAGPFGLLDSDAKNGVFLIRAIVNGETEWGWMKAWQLADAFQRGNTAAAVIDVRFNAPAGALDHTVNLAKDKIVSDSGNSPPAKLVGLVDDNLGTEVVLGQKKNDWVEIDLGRDRPIGEVRVFAKSPAFWDQFDVYVYATGQQPTETPPYARELDWKWSIANRRDADPKTPGVVSIAYRGRAARARYIRLVNKADSGPARLAEIRVVPLKVAP